MKNILLVPIRTDALFLSEDTMVADATADFSHLPYFNGSRDVNSDVANISENVISQPLADTNLRLRKGLHLHWALPDALNRGRHLDNGKTEFPILPNRWLVTRKMNDEEKSWVVESDYLFPEEKDLLGLAKDHPLRKSSRESITVPVEIGERESGNQPFRYMGRKMAAAEYDPNVAADRYPKLTTVGYGEPSFAAFYPNCRSVFGLHDEEIGKESGLVTYEIIGWYSNPNNDFFKNLTDRIVVITQQEFLANLPQLTREQAEGAWELMFKSKLLYDKIAKESAAERASIRPPSEWRLPNSMFQRPKADTFFLGVKILLDAIEKHTKERTGWALQPTFSQKDLERIAGSQGKLMLGLLKGLGWVSQVPRDPELFFIIEKSKLPPLPPLTFNVLLDDETRMLWAEIHPDLVEIIFLDDGQTQTFSGYCRIDDETLQQLERLLLALRIQFSPTQLLLHSIIDVNTDGKDGELPKKPDTGITVTIGNTGTEALSAYLGQQLSNVFGGNAKHIEEQLEALYLLDKLDHRILDHDAKFDEARHENGFNAVAGGHLWSISIESQNNEAADASKEAAKPKLPADIAALLNQTNVVQQRYDRSKAELESLGTQLFADWYKYMLSTYPPEDTRIDYPNIDEVRYFIEEQVMKPLREKEAETGFLVFAKPGEIAEGKPLAAATDSNLKSTANLLAGLLNQLFVRLNEMNAKLPTGSSFFVLKQLGGPRYYEPKEPVLLLANDSAGNSILQPTIRHGQDGSRRSDGLLDVLVINVDETGYLDIPGKLKKLPPRIEKLLPEVRTKEVQEIVPEIGSGTDKIAILPKMTQSELLAARGIGYNYWEGQPWNPFRLDWEVELLPLAEGTNLEELDYAANLVEQSFKLPVNVPDLVPDFAKIASFEGRNPNIYVGKSLLTPQAKRNLNGRLEAILREKMPGVNLSEFAADEALTKQKVAELGGLDDPLATALWAYHFLQNEHLHLLSQALSGFNAALVQLRQTLQLPIADPIGFLDYQPLTQAVAQLAENSTQLAPQPLTDFNPICTGKLIINQLRLVDTFGQVQDIGLGKLDRVLGAGATQTQNADSKIEVPLQPRLAQPARLNFRWLNAREGKVEMNAVSTTSPICGWVLTNQLDDSIVVYDAEGVMLGSIEAEDDGGGLARWNTAPGALSPVFPDTIGNVFLKRMVAKIRSGGPEFVAQFLDGMDAVLRNIEPEEFESQQALSLLIGRPVALVRASLNLELQGMPAVDQGWKSFYDDRKDGDFDRKKDGFTKVKFPVRIGKHDQFNDGLVGFWKEEGHELSEHFFLNQLPLPSIEHTEIQMLDDEKIPIFQSIDDAPQLVSMLIDPRGKVHVTTGILPVKDINIPAEHYLPAMQRMGVTFLTSPLLSPSANIQSLLPTEEGFQWTWVERQGEQWREVFPFPTIERGVFLQALAEGILKHLESIHWVQRQFADTYLVVPENERQLLTGQFEAVEADIFAIIKDNTQEMPMDDSSFSLQLSKKIFAKRIASNNEPGGKVWNLLVLPEVGWCQPIPDRPDTYMVKPKAQRTSQILPELGMEFLVEEILQTHPQVLREPRMDAHFDREHMTIREGYLKLNLA